MQYTKKKKVKFVNVEHVVSKILCNKCGKSVLLGKDPVVMSGCSVNVYFGYGSNKDLQSHMFDLCDDCYDEFVTTFKLKVVATDEE